MAGACPSCGVAVVPGYVRCPRCHQPLPPRPSRIDFGGTAVDAPRSKAPMVVILAMVGLLIASAIVYAIVRKSAGPSATSATTATVNSVTPTPTTAAQAPGSTPVSLAAVTPQNGPSAGAVANALQSDLQHRHLWSTVEIVGDRVDIHSSTCRDPAMKPMLDRAAGDFKPTGVHQLRCLEESGKLVLTRDL